MVNIDDRLSLIEARLDLIEEVLTLLPAKERLMRNEGLNDEEASKELEVRGLRKAILDERERKKSN